MLDRQREEAAVGVAVEGFGVDADDSGGGLLLQPLAGVAAVDAGAARRAPAGWPALRPAPRTARAAGRAPWRPARRPPMAAWRCRRRSPRRRRPRRWSSSRASLDGMSWYRHGASSCRRGVAVGHGAPDRPGVARRRLPSSTWQRRARPARRVGAALAPERSRRRPTAAGGWCCCSARPASARRPRPATLAAAARRAGVIVRWSACWSGGAHRRPCAVADAARPGSGSGGRRPSAEALLGSRPATTTPAPPRPASSAYAAVVGALEEATAERPACWCSTTSIGPTRAASSCSTSSPPTCPASPRWWSAPTGPPTSRRARG